MEKRGIPIYLKGILVILVIILINLGGVLFIYGNFSHGISGFSIADNLTKIYKDIPSNSKLVLLAQWAIVALLFVFAIRREASARYSTAPLKQVNISKKNEYETDFDVFYSLLKNKKKIKVSDAAKLFKLNENVILGWAKILETNNIAEIEYLRMSRAVIKLVE